MFELCYLIYRADMVAFKYDGFKSDKTTLFLSLWSMQQTDFW